MKIKKVELVNFKNHENSSFTFDNGVNLILGLNGAGKSSILEAIGLSLFNVKNTKNLEDYIKTGEKKAQIKVEFEGNDGLSYTVLRYIGTSRKYELYISGSEKSNKITREIQAKVAEICGIKSSNIENIYTNIICGYQNELTEAFGKNDSDRKKLFDKIFEIDTYESIYNELLNVKREYERKKSELEVEASIYRESLQKYANLDKEISGLKIEILKLEKEEKNLRNEIEKREEIKKVLEDKVNNIESMKKQIESLEKELRKDKELLEKNEKEFLRAKKAKEIVENNKEAYNRYIQLENKEKDLKEKLSFLEDLNKEKLDLESQLRNIEKDIAVKKTEIESIKSSSNEKSQRLKELQSQRIEKEETIESYREEYEKLKKELRKLKDEEKVIGNKLRKKRELENELSLINKKIQELKNKEAQINELKSHLEQVNLMIENLKNVESKKETLENKLKTFLIEKENMEKNSSALRRGICPIFNEKCKNVEGGEYFAEKIKELDERIRKTKEDLKEANSKFEELKRLKEQNSRLLIMIETIEKDVNQINTFKNQKALLEKEILQLTVTDELYELKRNAVIEFERRISKVESKIKMEIENSNSILREVRKIENELSSVDVKTENLGNEISKLVAKKNRLMEDIEKLNRKAEELPQAKKKYDDLLQEIGFLRKSYELYLSNESMAERILEIEEIISKLKQDIEKNLKLKREIEEKILSENIAEIMINLERTTEDLKKSQNRLEEVLGKLAQERQKLEEFESRKKEKEETQMNLEKALKEKKIVEKKLALLDKYRNNIKNMGTLISKEITKSVAIVATEYYKKITGKPEKILWLSEKSYEVYLANGENKRPYRILSGGEKVSVAIALRLALAKLYSNAGLLILDEPTSNLDKEKRQSLASAINVMLRDLDQAFIITHDETFTEMAQNIIYV